MRIHSLRVEIPRLAEALTLVIIVPLFFEVLSNLCVPPSILWDWDWDSELTHHPVFLRTLGSVKQRVQHLQCRLQAETA